MVFQEEYRASLQPLLDQIGDAEQGRREACQLALAALGRRQYLAVTATAAERNFAFRFKIGAPPIDPKFQGERQEFEAAIAAMLDAVWDTIRTGVEPPAEVTSVLVQRRDSQWFREGSLIAAMDPWSQTFETETPRWPTLFAEGLHVAATQTVPSSVFDGRRHWRESTFGEVDETYDLERYGPPYLLTEQNALMATSPLAAIPLSWVMRDTNFVELAGDPSELLVLRERAKAEIDEFANWRNLLLAVEFQQNGPLTIDEVWPSSAYDMIDGLFEELEGSFPSASS